MKTTAKHPLRESRIHECILDAAQKALSEAAGGLELPGFTTIVESEDETDGSAVIRVSYDTSFGGDVLWGVEQDFSLDENVFKGIVQGRKEDVAEFMVAFLPTYQSLVIGSYFDYLIGMRNNRRDEDDSSINHAALAEEVEWFQSFPGPWTTPCELVGASARTVTGDWFELKLRFENPDIHDSYSSIDEDEVAECDGLEIGFPISWKDYKNVRASEEGMHDLLNRVHGAFVVTGNTGSPYYSEYAQKLIDQFERADEDEEDEEDPFSSGELVFDSDGRVHAASDLD